MLRVAIQCSVSVGQSLGQAAPDSQLPLAELTSRESDGLLLLLLGLLDSLLFLLQDHLHVAGAIHVRPNATMGPVCASAALASLVHLDVVDVQGVRVQALELGVRLCVPQDVQQGLARLLGPAALCALELLRLGRPADAPGVLLEWDAPPLLDDVLEVLLRIPQGHPLDRHRGLISVLVMHTEVNALCLAGLGGVEGLAAVLAHGASWSNSSAAADAEAR